jgi:uncharacterized membrane protein
MKKLLGLILSLPLYLFPTKFAFAATSIDPCAGAEGIYQQACAFKADSFSRLIGTFIQAIFVIAVIIALGYLIYGAIRWIMSQGDKSKVTDARNHIIASIIGLIIVFLSFFIINVILSIFFNMSLTDLKLPTFNVAGAG